MLRDIIPNLFRKTLVMFIADGLSLLCSHMAHKTLLYINVLRELPEMRKGHPRRGGKTNPGEILTTAPFQE